MRYRPLGRTRLAVSEYTIGFAGVECHGADLKEAGAAVALARDHGVNAIELAANTAPVVGDVLRSANARQLHVFSRLSSLVPFDLPSPHVPVQQAYPGSHIRAETEALLRTLGVERVALQQLHAWCPEWLHEGDWIETLDRLRHEGKIAGFGISLFDHDADSALEAVASGAIDSVQVMYNIFDPGAAEMLLPLCHKHDVGVIARSPLYYGALQSGGARGWPEGDWRHDYFFEEHRRETDARVDRLAAEVEAPDRSVTDMALRFSLSHPAVSTVAVGMRTRSHVEANLRALEHGPLPAEQRARLAGHKWLF